MASLKKRGSSFYIQFYVAGNKQKRVNLHTDSYQIAKEKLRRFESAQAAGAGGDGHVKGTANALVLFGHTDSATRPSRRVADK